MSTKGGFGRRRILTGALAAAAAVLLPTPGIAQQRKPGIQGHMAPALKIDWWIDAQGKPTSFDLMAERGKWVYLKFWQSWCPGCHRHGLPSLEKFVRVFKDEPRVAAAGVQTVFEGFRTNTRDEVRKTQLQYNLAIPMGHDAGNPDGDHLPHTMRSYRSGGTPWVVIVRPDGRVVYNGFNINVDKLIAHVQQDLA
ncbi:MAG: TlpA disulfide reductase family protein [Pseudomonadota bacterium]